MEEGAKTEPPTPANPLTSTKTSGLKLGYKETDIIQQRLVPHQHLPTAFRRNTRHYQQDWRHSVLFCT